MDHAKCAVCDEWGSCTEIEGVPVCWGCEKAVCEQIGGGDDPPPTD